MHLSYEDSCTFLLASNTDSTGHESEMKAAPAHPAAASFSGFPGLSAHDSSRLASSSDKIRCSGQPSITRAGSCFSHFPDRLKSSPSSRFQSCARSIFLAPLSHMGFDSFPKESTFSVAQSANAGLPDSSAQTSSSTPDRRLSAPAALRNREFIAEVLKGVLPEQGTVLEIASGTGEHVSLFAATFPDLTWQPSDIDTQALASIEDWVKQSPLKNLLPPVTLNVEEDQWPLSRADAIININMIHISPYTACEGLMKGASRMLPEGGVLVLYGPFKRNGVHTAMSNEQFDASLRVRNPSWGVRDVAEVAATASSSGLKLKKEVSMPANNLVLVFQKQSSS